MADTQTGKLPKLGERLNRAAASSSGQGSPRLTCQWCSVTLPPGETVCPTCGSAGVADDSMVVPAVADEPGGDTVAVERKSEDELVEWWKEDDDESDDSSQATRNDDPLPVILGLVGAGVICVVLGIVVAPAVLTSIFENSLGVTVENPNDLRPLGGILGLLAGAFIGAIGMWVTAPRR